MSGTEIGTECLNATDWTCLPLEVCLEILALIITVFRFGFFGIKSNHHKVTSMLVPT